MIPLLLCNFLLLTHRTGPSFSHMQGHRETWPNSRSCWPHRQNHPWSWCLRKGSQMNWKAMWVQASLGKGAKEKAPSFHLLNSPTAAFPSAPCHITSYSIWPSWSLIKGLDMKEIVLYCRLHKYPIINRKQFICLKLPTLSFCFNMLVLYQNESAPLKRLFSSLTMAPLWEITLKSVKADWPQAGPPWWKGQLRERGKLL